MSNVHQLILQHGHSEARRLLPEGKQLIDMAAVVMAEDDPALSFTYSGFCLTSFPHKKLGDSERWERHGHNVTLTIDPGSLPDADGVTRVHGVPYGSRARMIMLYLQTRAVQTNNPEVELGASMRDWLGRMGISVGGKTLKEVRDQADRIAACNLTFTWRTERGSGFVKGNIVKGGFRLQDLEDRSEQPRLWVDTVRLSDDFFQALRDHPVPVNETALRQIANNSAAIDLYTWLAYRLHALSKPTPVTWAAMHQQFGAGYKLVRQFKAKFGAVLEAALAVYPEAVVTIDDQGVTLYPSPPPIRERVTSIR